VIRAAALLLALILLTSCGTSPNGNSGATRGPGKATISIKWPIPGKARVIPAASQSITITIQQGKTVLQTQTVARPTTGNTSSTVFTNLPLGSLLFTATAYPNADGTGIAQATGTAVETIAANVATNVTVDMNSTVTLLVPSVSVLPIAVGRTAQVQVTTEDSAGDVVLTSTSSVTYVSANKSIATVDPNGQVNGIGAGQTTVTITDTDSGLTATINVVVSALIDHIYVADAGNNRIVRLDSFANYFENEADFGAFGASKNEFNYPCSVFVGQDNRIYICDQNNNRIVRMDDMNGTNWVTFGTQGSGIHQFSLPSFVFTSSTNQIYVADTGNNRIVRFDDMTGTNWVALGGPAAGSGTNQFNGPMSVWVGDDGHIYIADTNNGRCVRMDDMTGLNWTLFGVPFKKPVEVIYGTNRLIYVLDRAAEALFQADDINGTQGYAVINTVPPPSGCKVPPWLLPKDALASPSAAAIDEQGNVYIASKDDNRVIWTYDPEVAMIACQWPSVGDPDIYQEDVYNAYWPGLEPPYLGLPVTFRDPVGLAYRAGPAP
jgi:hypothetical protein